MTRAATVCIVKREAPLYTSILGSRSIAAAIVLMVTSPLALGRSPWGVPLDRVEDAGRDTGFHPNGLEVVPPSVHVYLLQKHV